MRPITLELQAFGPYKNHEKIDFTDLASAGIFLIKGPTGSGKTTLIDAMTIALYGGCSGENVKVKTGRNDFAAWRCNQAEDSVDTYVSFTFAVGDCTYRFKRTMTKKRTAWSESYEAEYLDENGVFCPFFESAKEKNVNDKAVEIIGLDKEQFRQVVLLPQGQFEKFLTANSDEKEAILKKIFGAENWEQYAKNYYEAAKNRVDALDKVQAEVEARLKVYSDQGVGHVADLATLADSREVELQNLEAAHKAFDGDKRQDQLNKDRELCQQFAEMHRLEQQIAGLEAQKEQIDAARTELGAALKAEPVREFARNLRDKQDKVQYRETVYAQMNSKTNSLEEKAVAISAELTKHKSDSPVAGYQSEIGKLESKADVYENIDNLRQEAGRLKLENEKKQETLNVARQNVEQLKATAAKAKEAYDQAEATAKDYRDRYYAGIYGEIAAEQLKEGEACPICGSKIHPFPAKRSPESIRKDDVDWAEKKQSELKTKWNEVEAARVSAEADFQKATENATVAGQQYAEAKTRYDEATVNLVEGIATRRDLDKQIAALQENIRKYSAEEQQLETATQKANNELTAHKTAVEKAREEMSKAEQEMAEAKQALMDKVAECGYANPQTAMAALRSDSQRRVLQGNINAYDTSLKNYNEQLADKRNSLKDSVEPDSRLLDARQTEISDERTEYAAKSQAYANDIQRFRKDYEELKVKEDQYASQITQAESDLTFAKRLRGDAGVGLGRYVLGIMFDQVIGEANHMLKKVHGGRYYLVRTNDKGEGNKRGLELKAHDSRSPEDGGRSVSMLSGGEKFLVSLALSIGISAVAQQSGVKIDAMFIDEGFGTLDDDSINDAMDVLKSVQRSNGMIGIISHVKLLEENISHGIEVVKTDGGSSLKIC